MMLNLIVQRYNLFLICRTVSNIHPMQIKGELELLQTWKILNNVQNGNLSRNCHYDNPQEITSLKKILCCSSVSK